MRRVTGNRHGDQRQNSPSYTQGHLLMQPLVVHSTSIYPIKTIMWHHLCRHITQCRHRQEHRRQLVP